MVSSITNQLFPFVYQCLPFLFHLSVTFTWTFLDYAFCVSSSILCTCILQTLGQAQSELTNFDLGSLNSNYVADKDT